MSEKHRRAMPGVSIPHFHPDSSGEPACDCRKERGVPLGKGDKCLIVDRCFHQKNPPTKAANFSDPAALIFSVKNDVSD
jgi:hypothetical protein